MMYKMGILKHEFTSGGMSGQSHDSLPKTKSRGFEPISGRIVFHDVRTVCNGYLRTSDETAKGCLCIVRVTLPCSLSYNTPKLT